MVPNSTAGMIIGKGGTYIKQIKEESGAYVQISQKAKDQSLAERCITVICKCYSVSWNIRYKGVHSHQTRLYYIFQNLNIETHVCSETHYSASLGTASLGKLNFVIGFKSYSLIVSNQLYAHS